MFNRDCTHTISSARALPCEVLETDRGTVAGWLNVVSRNLSRMIAEWKTRSLHRRYLSEMSDYQLRDVGISRELADREASQPFWVGPIRVDDWSRR